MYSTKDLDDVIIEIEQKFGKPEIDEKRVRVACPSCGKTGYINVGTWAVMETRDHVFEYAVIGEICDHNFKVRVDGNFKAR